eukprot:scaffold26792_cov130-Amphora_coffeaeformis.AAC.1
MASASNGTQHTPKNGPIGFRINVCPQREGFGFASSCHHIVVVVEKNDTHPKREKKTKNKRITGAPLGTTIITIGTHLDSCSTKSIISKLLHTPLYPKHTTMKLAFFSLVCTSATAFVPTTLPRRQSLLERAAEAEDATKQGKKNYHTFLDDLFVHHVQEEWQEEIDHLQHYEKAALSDPDLVGILEAPHKPAAPVFRQREEHRHDSLLDEVAHAIDTDPDLAPIVGSKKESDSLDSFIYRETEAHRHDSLLDEVQHSIDTDEYLNP